MALVPASSGGGSAQAITPTTDNANITITQSNCFKVGDLVHVYVLLTATGTISSAYNVELIKGLPTPSSTKYGTLSAKNGSNLVIGSVSIEPTGKLKQGGISILNANDYLVCTVDYLV